ncbi:MAG: hypothetical protein K0R14_257 [Burkholderiales bacterium]|jgi:hypothetical protein|nr:hypothetical protein [Burkholderiales bacterium]
MKLKSITPLMISLLFTSSVTIANEEIPAEIGHYTSNGICVNDWPDNPKPYPDTTTSVSMQVFNYVQNIRTIVQFSGSQSSCVYNHTDPVCTKQLKNNEPAPSIYDTPIAAIPNGSRTGFVQLPNMQFWGSCNVPGSINLIVSVGPDQYKINLAGFSPREVNLKPTNSGYIKRVTINDNRQSDIYLMYYNSIYKTENFGTNNILYITNEQPDGGFIQNLDNTGLHDFELYICPKQKDPNNPDPNTCKIPPRQKP